MVARAWDLTGLVERYAAFVSEFEPYLRSRVDDDAAFLVRTRLMHMFRGFPFLDPELPDELAPVSRPRDAAVAVFHGVFERLSEGSQRHFDAVVAGVAVAAV